VVSSGGWDEWLGDARKLASAKLAGQWWPSVVTFGTRVTPLLRGATTGSTRSRTVARV